MIRWLDVSGRHVILRPNQNGKEFPLIPVEYDAAKASSIIGQVVWSWSRFWRRISRLRMFLLFACLRVSPRAILRRNEPR